MTRHNVRFSFLLVGALLLAGCFSRARVGELQTESQTVELGDAEAVRVEIDFGAGDLEVAGGAANLLEADFTYNVAALKPQVEYGDGTLVVRQPAVDGLPVLRGITDFRNEWTLHLDEEVPMDLSVKMGAGTSDLQLAGLSLTALDVSFGAGEYTVDLSCDWSRDLDVAVDAGLADITVRLPGDVGARVEIEDGPHTVDTSGLTQAENVYTNAAYGVSDVTLRVHIEVGPGQIHLDVEK
jgi:hypothetical protein